MLAFAAGHVVAAAVLLDRRLALGAFLGVGRNPVGRFRVILTLLQPHLDELAGSGLVVVECASEAEPVLTSATHCRHDAGKFSRLYRAVDGVFTVGGRTPLEIVLVVNVGAHEEIMVSIWGQKSGHLTNRRQQLTDP